MRANNSFRWKINGTLLIVLLFATNAAHSQSIPEPGLILYGQVRNIATGGSLMTYGTLRWTIQPPSGSAIVVATPLTNINDQFSYVLRVPFETPLSGFTISPNTLALSNSPLTYTRSASVNLQAATILSPASSSFSFGAADRGRSERVDLQVSIAMIDSDNNGLDDNWEMTYFGHLGLDPNADPDHDGMSNLGEFRAGTNPNDSQSRFAFVAVARDPAGGIDVRWSSVALHRYTIQRSGNLLGAFSNLQTNIDATPGTNFLRDATATNQGPYFYRVRVE